MKTTVRYYEEYGEKYQFDAEGFHRIVNQRKDRLRQCGSKTTNAEIMEQLADEMFVTPDAVKNWMYGKNGPSDLEQVKSLGALLKIDYHAILKKEDGQMKESNQIIINNDVQAQITKDAVRSIYKSLMFFVRLCETYQARLCLAYDGPTQFEDGEDADKVFEKWNPCEEYLATKELGKQELTRAFNTADNLLRDSLLDIPETLYKKIYNHLWEELYEYIEFLTGPNKKPSDYTKDVNLFDYEEYLDGRIGDFLGKEGHMDYYRELFSDYIVR